MTETRARPQASATAEKVPMPQPRPLDAPQSKKAADGKAIPADSTKEATKDSSKVAAPGKDEAVAPAPPQPSACRLALTDQIAVAPSVPAIHGPGACGGDDLVRLEAVVLPDKRKVVLTPAGTMRCPMATAVANWVRNDIAPLTPALGSPLAALDNFDSYECRGRNGVAGAPLSEHGHANAIDVHGFKLADGRMIELTDRSQPRELRENMLHSACTRFTTVLGPDSDGYHEDHIHLDLMQRHNDYRICQWDVLDPLPKIAPLLPEARPEEAPPRETVAAEEADKKGQTAPKASAPSAKAAETAPGKAAAHATGPDDAKKEQAVPSGKAATGKPAPDQTTQDHPASDKVSQGKTAQDKAAQDKAAAGAVPPAKSAPESRGTDQPRTERPSSDKASEEKASTDKADKPSENTGSKERTSAENSPKNNASKDKASTAKVAAHKPTPRRHRHHRSGWNPFGVFF